MAALLSAAAGVAACGASSATPPQSADTPAAPSAAPAVEPPPPAADAGPPPPTGAQKRKLELFSACDTQTTIYIGDDPAAGGDGKKNITANGGADIPRRPDGTQTVWLLDQAGAPLIKVSITRGMKRIDIGKSCRTFDAR